MAGCGADRAGRRGVAISLTWTPPPDNPDKNRYEDVLVFNPDTGELMAYESIALTPHRETRFYHLILDADRTDRLG